MRVLMLLDNPCLNDRRVQRESQALVAAGHDVTLVCMKSAKAPETEDQNGVKVIRWFDLDPLFDVKKDNYAPAMAKRLADTFSPDVLHTHDRIMLHVAKYFLKLQPHVKFVHDIHEMHFSYPIITEGASLMLRLKSWAVHRIRVRREYKDSKIIDRFITVNQSLETMLREHFHLPRKGVVVRNIPERESEPQKTNIIREHFGIADDTRILVFIGANIYPNVLNLEQVIDEIANKAGLALVFICTDNANKRMVEDYVKSKGVNNVYFHGLLPPADIPRYLASCDVGLVPTWNRKNLSYWYALDNKLFEYMMSEIPILATAQPEYISIVENHNIGVCVNPDEAGAYLNGLQSILANYDSYADALKKAKSVLNWETEQQGLVNLYKEIQAELAQ